MNSKKRHLIMKMHLQEQFKESDIKITLRAILW